MVEHNRRAFLKQVGTGAASLGGIAAVTADVSADSVGLRDQIRRLIRNGYEDRAEHLMEVHGIEYASSRGTLDDPQEAAGEGSEVGTFRYGSPDEEPETDCYMGIVADDSKGDDVYEVFFQWHLVPWSNIWNPDNACGDDAAGVFWNNDYWQPYEIGRDNFYEGNQDRVNYGEYDPQGNGIVAKVNDPDRAEDIIPSISEFTAGFSTYVEAVQPDADRYPIKGKYIHNYVGPLTTCLGLNVTVGIGPAGVSTSGAPKNWSMSVQESI